MTTRSSTSTTSLKRGNTPEWGWFSFFFPKNLARRNCGVYSNRCKKEDGKHPAQSERNSEMTTYTTINDYIAQVVNPALGEYADDYDTWEIAQKHEI